MKRFSVAVACACVMFAVTLTFAGCGKKKETETTGAEPPAVKNVKPDVYKEGELTEDLFPIPDGYMSIVLVGDIMTWDKTKPYLEKHGVEYPFRGTAALLQTADLTIGNLEGPVAVEAVLKKTHYPYKVPPWTLEGLVWAGFDQVSLANNHLADCRRDGMFETMKYVDEYKIGRFGAGKNLDEAREPTIVEVNGMKVGLCAAVAVETYFHDIEASRRENAYKDREKLIRRQIGARKNQPGTIIATKKSVVDMVKKAREQADFVIVYPHWGIRYHRPATDFQREVAHAAIDAGADLIVGHHSHFWQPVEVYRGKPIVYGIGNFAFGSGNRRAKSGLLVRALVKDNRVETVELFPTYSKNKDKLVRYQTKIMKGKFAKAELEALATLSAELNAKVAIEKGRGVLRLN